MAKTRRLISENLKNVDFVIEVLDARIPQSSRNPEIESICKDKPRIVLLNKASLANPAANASWKTKLTDKGSHAILTDCVTGEGLSQIKPAVTGLLSDKIERYESKNMAGRKLYAMVLGIPNVGKSSLINKLSGNKKAKVENRPGVTTDKQWYSTSMGIELLDTPGVLWPKFEDKKVGENLALTGAIRDGILNVEELACVFCGRMQHDASCLDMFCGRYKMAPEKVLSLSAYDLFLEVGRKRGFLIPGNEIDTLRTANMLLEEFRNGKIGRISLEG